MYLRILLHFISLCLLVIIQLAILPHLPWSLSYLNIIIVALIFSLVFLDFNWSAGWWLTVGWLLGLFSFSNFINWIIIMTVIFLFSYWLLINFFTNRSLYSLLLLTGIALIINDLGLYGLNYLTAKIQGSSILALDSSFWLLELQRLTVNLILVIVLFYIFNIISYRFRPVLRKN